jgi:hypothetical protein
MSQWSLLRSPEMVARGNVITLCRQIHDRLMCIGKCCKLLPRPESQRRLRQCGTFFFFFTKNSQSEFFVKKNEIFRLRQHGMVIFSLFGKKGCPVPPCRRQYPPPNVGSPDPWQHWSFRGVRSFRVVRGPTSHCVTRVNNKTSRSVSRAGGRVYCRQSGLPRYRPIAGCGETSAATSFSVRSRCTSSHSALPSPLQSSSTYSTAGL